VNLAEKLDPVALATVIVHSPRAEGNAYAFLPCTTSDSVSADEVFALRDGVVPPTMRASPRRSMKLSENLPGVRAYAPLEPSGNVSFAFSPPVTVTLADPLERVTGSGTGEPAVCVWLGTGDREGGDDAPEGLVEVHAASTSAAATAATGRRTRVRIRRIFA